MDDLQQLLLGLVVLTLTLLVVLPLLVVGVELRNVDSVPLERKIAVKILCVKNQSVVAKLVVSKFIFFSLWSCGLRNKGWLEPKQATYGSAYVQEDEYRRRMR